MAKGRSDILGPGHTVGILGGGQLGRMLAMAAARLGLRVHVYSPPGDNPAFDVAHAHTAAPWDDEDALARFAAAVDVVTYEFENVPLATAAFLVARVPVRPGVKALEVAQDRLNEKRFASSQGIETAPFAEVDNEADLNAAIARVGLPAILKTRRLGYDGKGQALLKPGGDAASAWRRLGQVPCILEGFVAFSFEVSVIAARGLDGRVEVFDLPLNVHENGILRRSRVPAPVSEATAGAARALAGRLLAALDYVGVLAVELFAVSTESGRNDGEMRLLFNEMAPRVHNSGHWTEAACTVSQFEQHIRAICGWPLARPRRLADCEMENLLGDEVRAWRELAAEPDTVVHIYGKAEARPGRKMGHVTRLKPRE
jgi:5-(carboxyamino)imidazole ribonucleotide synthase